jgi:Ca-activated chloride channel homolog
VLVALTDGNDTASQMPPAKGAQIAKDKGIVIHTISVGDPSAAGEDALDIDTLKAVATNSGGTYAHAADRKQLDEIYHKIDALETQQAETISHTPKRDIYWWPLALALATTMLQHARQLAMDRHRSHPRPSSSTLEIGYRGARTKHETVVT